MPAIVSLRDVVREMDTPSSEIQAFINRATGELFSASEDEQSELEAAEEGDDFADAPEWQREELIRLREVLSSDDWLKLPSSFEFDEYGIMERFAGIIEDPILRGDLLDTIGGKGTFGRFKNMLQRRGMQDKYYAFRETELGEIAMQFLEANGIKCKP
jgi:hypothetical protein